MLILVIIISCLAGGIWLFLKQPQFGRLPEGEELKRLEQSPHYAAGQFHNQLPTASLLDDTPLVVALVKFIFSKPERPQPQEPVPSVKTDLTQLAKTEDVVVWLGHSSYFLQLAGRRMLIDPVLSSYASPLSCINKAFAGSNPYTPEDMPEIDYLLVSHDHWDHLDYATVKGLQYKVKQVICPLGVGSYFRQWGFPAEAVHEGEWFSSFTLEPEVTVHVLPTRHFSGRMLTRNKTLWGGFAVITPTSRVYYSGDGGYGPHFKEIGETFGGFDLALMENGQYGVRWPDVHMVPEETAQAAVDVKAKAVLPGHTAKFKLAQHAWDDPYQRIAAASAGKPYRLLTPLLGEPVAVHAVERVFPAWWQTIQ